MLLLESGPMTLPHDFKNYRILVLDVLFVIVYPNEGNTLSGVFSSVVLAMYIRGTSNLDSTGFVQGSGR